MGCFSLGRNRYTTTWYRSHMHIYHSAHVGDSGQLIEIYFLHISTRELKQPVRFGDRLLCQLNHLLYSNKLTPMWPLSIPLPVPTQFAMAFFHSFEAELHFTRWTTALACSCTWFGCPPPMLQRISNFQLALAHVVSSHLLSD